MLAPMIRTLALSLLIVGVAACSSKKNDAKKSPEPTKPSLKETPVTDEKEVASDTDDGLAGTQVQIGGGDRRELGFAITAVHDKQQPTEQSPWYGDGGDWTYLEAKTKGATFVLGFQSQPLEGVPFERATAMLIAPDKASVEALTKELATVLGTKPPDRFEHTGKPLKMSGVVLGRDQARTESGYGGEGGGWVTCKWTIEGETAAGEPENAEVYFNFNLDEKQGVFAEKDEIYNDFLIESLATRL